MKDARNELAKVIVAAYGEDAKVECPCEQDLDVADAILAAGYRKQLTIDNEKLVIDDGLLLLDVGKCTCSPYGASHEPHCGFEYIDDLTKPLARAGYRKPRTVSTVAELDALPDGSAIHARWIDVIQPSVMVKEDATWYCNADGYFYDSTDLTLPATVLYTPAAPTETGTQA